MFKLNNVYERSVVVTNAKRCPHIIHQIVPDINNVPAGLYHTIKHNIKLNPEFEYRIYDNNSILEILKHEFDQTSIDAYNSTDNYKIKSDFIKLAFILRYGGIFIDVKNICVIKLIKLMRINNVFYIHDIKNNSIDLSLLASHADNPGVRNAFNQMAVRLLQKYYGDDPNDILGGRILSEQLFYLGYLNHFSLLKIEDDPVIICKTTNKNVLKIYNSFDKENIKFGLSPDPTIEWKEKILFN
jgi:hypothetical protein